MFSLPQPSNEIVDGLPVLHVSEDAELVRALLTVLYPIPSEIPVAYDRALSLLAASHKYDMPAVQSSIRAEVSHRKLMAETGEQAFRAYAIANKHGLSPETNTTAHLTLDYPMTFESIGSGLAQFEGWALHDLAAFRRCRRNELFLCFRSFLDVTVGPSRIWIDCPEAKDPARGPGPLLPTWLSNIFNEEIGELRKTFTKSLIQPTSIRKKYLAALRSHTIPDTSNPQKQCAVCFSVHVRKGEEY